MNLLQAIPMILVSCFLLASTSAVAERSTYIIHMDKSFMPKSYSSDHYWYSSLLQSTKSNAQTRETEPKIIYTYNHAFHGSESELAALKSSPGFLSAYADNIVTADTTHTYKFLSLNTATGIWPASQYGEDVITGVIDSGIWPESPSFNGDGMTQVPTPVRTKLYCVY